MNYGGKPVPNSPFRVRAGPPFDASKVKVTGPGVDEAPLTDEPTQFVCDCTEAGTAPLTGTTLSQGLSAPLRTARGRKKSLRDDKSIERYHNQCMVRVDSHYLKSGRKALVTKCCLFNTSDISLTHCLLSISSHGISAQRS